MSYTTKPANSAAAGGHEPDFMESEATTRARIDRQLREAGWKADSQKLRHGSGTRPKKGVNQAIAEWPTDKGPADYVLFAGLQPLAVVEAKPTIKDVAGKLPQACRYSRGFQMVHCEPPGGPWGSYRVPVAFATNGRAYNRQVLEKSGIWFHDLRLATNHPRALTGWYTPDGLKSLLRSDIAKENRKLQRLPRDIAGLRPYQILAVEAVDDAIAAGKREMLLAMATGTGKTRVCLALLYRLIKAGRFRRVLFLVDREWLGEQATDTFKEVKIEGLQAFDAIYGLKELDDIEPDPNTRVHMATVQGMVKRLLYPSKGAAPIPVDRYDCIVVDECHRGYALDRDARDSESLFADESDYISKYRRILDHFDAVKIGVTATPALHTTEIFGKPIYTYSYRQAVVDTWLVDHEPPIRIITELSKSGIKWKKGDPMKLMDPRTGVVDLTVAPDEVKFEVDDFNKHVLTEPFNRTVCEELAKHIDPRLPGKTLVYCVKDTHADLVVRLLKECFEKEYGPIDDDTVVKITGQSDKPKELTRRYRNEKLPNVAVTVDLLTTGVDVHEIVNLVFIRRVGSRILYEQMLGRATRLCPNLFGPGEDKEIFRIYDAVDLYASLQDYSTMKPVVTDPTRSLNDLVARLLKSKYVMHRRDLADQIRVRIGRKTRLIREHEDKLQAKFRLGAEELLRRVAKATVSQMAGVFRKYAGLAKFIDDLIAAQKVAISEHPDKIDAVSRGYGDSTKPKDYLDGFGRWLRENMNKVPALLAVKKRPASLTRQQLKEITLVLDGAGFTETGLRVAWREWKNEDIAARIIGFIRHKALGSPLVPYGERVDRALREILAEQKWTGPQREWLRKLANQIRVETIVDRDALDHGVFESSGGFARLDRTFGGNLQSLLEEFHERIWNDAA